MNFIIIKNFIKKITFIKVLNYLLVKFSYFLALITKKSIRWGFSFSVSIEVSALCNLNCVQCPTGNNLITRKKGNMSLECFDKIIQQTNKYLFNILFYFQGEPFMNNKIYDFIKIANEKNIFTITSTNGHFLTKNNCKKIIDSKLDKIIISLDGTNQETYEKYRKNGSFSQVINGINNLLEAKILNKSKTPYIEVQFLVFKHNEHQLNEMKLLAKKLKIDKLNFKSAQVYNFEEDNLYITNNTKYSRYELINNKHVLKQRIKNRCKRLWNTSVITYNGDILPCCFDKDAKYIFGNIYDSPFITIIKNEKFKKFAKQVLTNRKKIDICNNCTE